MSQIRQLFRENPDYIRLLSEPSIPNKERIGLIDKAFGDKAEKYLISFLKLLCERNILAEFSGCCDEFTRRYNVSDTADRYIGVGWSARRIRREAAGRHGAEPPVWYFQETK